MLGALFLGEPMSFRMMLAIVIVLAGVVIVLYSSVGRRMPANASHLSVNGMTPLDNVEAMVTTRGIEEIDVDAKNTVIARPGDTS